MGRNKTNSRHTQVKNCQISEDIRNVTTNISERITTREAQALDRQIPLLNTQLSSLQKELTSLKKTISSANKDSSDLPHEKSSLAKDILFLNKDTVSFINDVIRLNKSTLNLHKEIPLNEEDVPLVIHSTPKELKNSQNRISVTRTYKKYDKSSLYSMAKEMSQPDDDGCLYLSKFQVYKNCRNKVTEPHEYMNKVDDSRFLVLSRITLPKEFECYLFSLIHSDIFNFDSEGNFVCEQTQNFFSTYSELQSQLRYSIILDGLLLAIDDIITNNNSNYYITIGNEVCLSNSDGDTISNFDTPLLKLLNKMSPTFTYFSRISEIINSTNKNKKREKRESIEVNKLMNKCFLTSRKYMHKRLEWLFDEYNKKVIPLFNDPKSELSFLDKLINLYHINRYTHIFDMLFMKNYNEATINYHKIDGLLTSATIHNIFDKDLARDKPEFKNETIIHTSISENVYSKHSTAPLSERDITLIRTMIHNIAFIVKDYYFNKAQSNKSTDSIVNYETAVEILDGFSNKETAEQLASIIYPNDMYLKKDEKDKKDKKPDIYHLRRINFSQSTLKEYHHCYQLIYDDLVRNINDNA